MWMRIWVVCRGKPNAGQVSRNYVYVTRVKQPNVAAEKPLEPSGECSIDL